ncbi:hypothetical protein KAR91_82965 [Candidatus Pacearchaeota archaeon]|nr:hypothetical protein [Candidatus Pacearchaeota archaeon]
MAKFRYIGENMVIYTMDGERKELPVNAYLGNKLKKGDTIEFDGWIAEKARKNPSYEEVKEKKRGPKPKKEVVQEDSQA